MLHFLKIFFISEISIIIASLLFLAAPERPLRSRRVKEESNFKPIAPAPRSYASRHEADTYTKSSYTTRTADTYKRSSTSTPRDLGSSFSAVAARHDYRSPGTYLSTTTRSMSREPTPVSWKRGKCAHCLNFFMMLSIEAKANSRDSVI